MPHHFFIGLAIHDYFTLTTATHDLERRVFAAQQGFTGDIHEVYIDDVQDLAIWFQSQSDSYVLIAATELQTWRTKIHPTASDESFNKKWCSTYLELHKYSDVSGTYTIDRTPRLLDTAIFYAPDLSRLPTMSQIQPSSVKAELSVHITPAKRLGGRASCSELAYNVITTNAL
jgi:hypothetical protein